MSNATIYYFLIANNISKKEIGNFVDNSDNLNNINDFNNIVSHAKDLLYKIESTNKNKKNLNYIYFYLFIYLFILFNLFNNYFK